MRTPPVVLCVLNFRYGFCHDIMRGVNRFVGRTRTDLLFHPLSNPRALADFIEDDSISGVIGFLSGRTISKFKIPAHFCAVNISNFSRTPFPSLLNDDYTAGYNAAQIIARTRPSSSLVIADKYGVHQIERRNGAARVLEESGIPCRTYLLKRTAAENLSRNQRWSEAVIRELNRLLSIRREDLPMAIVATDYIVGELVAMVIRSKGFEIPGDFRIIGVGKPGDRIVPIGRQIVSTIPLDWERLGEEAAAMISDWIENNVRPPQVSTIAPLDPIIRESTRLALDSVVDQAQSIVEEHKDYSITIEEIANKLGMSVTTLIRRFRRECSLTPKEMLLRWRMEEAKRLLSESQFDVAGVACRCGYADHSTFSAAFRTRVGKTPSAWRRESSL